MSELAEQIRDYVRLYQAHRSLLVIADKVEALERELAEKDAEITKHIRFNDDAWHRHRQRTHELCEDRLVAEEGLDKANRRISELEAKIKSMEREQ